MKKTGNEISPPDVLNIDPCTHCQLRCPGCPNTDLGHPPGMGWGWLRFDRFKDLIETTPHFGHVRLDCFGEAFLNPDLYRILEYGSGKGLSFSFSSANFNHVRPEVLDALDLQQCPQDFAKAIRRHADAWRESISFFAQFEDLRGELHEVFEIIREQGGSARTGLEQAEAAIWSNWVDVEKAMENQQ